VEEVVKISIVLVAIVPKLQLLNVVPEDVLKKIAFCLVAFIVQLLKVFAEEENIPIEYPDVALFEFEP